MAPVTASSRARRKPAHAAFGDDRIEPMIVRLARKLPHLLPRKSDADGENAFAATQFIQRAVVIAASVAEAMAGSSERPQRHKQYIRREDARVRRWLVD